MDDLGWLSKEGSLEQIPEELPKEEWMKTGVAGVGKMGLAWWGLRAL
jgi:hypothetical protein